MKRHELVKEHIKRIRSRYQAGSKFEKKLILDEITKTWEVDRKHVIKCLKIDDLPKSPKGPRGRKSKYNPDLARHIFYLWDQMERISAKRMKEALPLWLPFYRSLGFTPRLKDELLSMSASTLERWIISEQKRLEVGKSTTRKPKFFRHQIPLLDGGVTRDLEYPGHVHADTVAHCGESLMGQFANSLTVVDRYSGWTCNRALINKAATSVKEALRSIEGQSLPFRIRSFQTDCGSEFLNYLILHYLQHRPYPVHVTRSRPYHKNDNAHVEQKNYTHVREVFGYDRFEGEEIIPRMNDIYENLWNPLNNFFLPSMKLLHKERYGGRIIKKHEKAKTPYQRLMECKHLDDTEKVKLEEQFKSLNPFELKTRLEQRLKEFFILARRLKTSKIAT